jgi:hypothetical protein
MSGRERLAGRHPILRGGAKAGEWNAAGAVYDPCAGLVKWLDGIEP